MVAAATAQCKFVDVVNLFGDEDGVGCVDIGTQLAEEGVSISRVSFLAILLDAARSPINTCFKGMSVEEFNEHVNCPEPSTIETLGFTKSDLWAFISALKTQTGSVPCPDPPVACMDNCTQCTICEIPDVAAGLCDNCGGCTDDCIDSLMCVDNSQGKTSTDSPSTTEEEDEDDGISGGAVVGAVLGGMVGFGVLVGLMAYAIYKNI